MAQEILTAKLNELDRQLRKLHRQIQKSSPANPIRLPEGAGAGSKESRKMRKRCGAGSAFPGPGW